MNYQRIFILCEIFNIKSLEGNGLRHLSSLENILFNKCPGLVSLPEKTFPSSLKSLSFCECPRLESYLEKTFLSSLKALSFYECPRLVSFPEDSLPTSFEQLNIEDSPLLEERYKRKEHWSKICHIPVIGLNGQLTIL